MRIGVGSPSSWTSLGKKQQISTLLKTVKCGRVRDLWNPMKMQKPSLETKFAILSKVQN